MNTLGISLAGQWVQNVGTVAFALLATLLASIAVHSHRYRRYGREALLCTSVLLFVFTVTRALSSYAKIEPETARSVNGIAVWATLAIVLQLAILRRKEDGLTKR